MLVRYFICEGCDRPIPVIVEDKDTEIEPNEPCPHCDGTTLRPTNIFQTVTGPGEIHLAGMWCNECEQPFYILDEAKDDCLCPYCMSDDYAPI